MPHALQEACRSCVAQLRMESRVDPLTPAMGGERPAYLLIGMYR
jgi:hypothetical protein